MALRWSLRLPRTRWRIGTSSLLLLSFIGTAIVDFSVLISGATLAVAGAGSIIGCACLLLGFTAGRDEDE